MEEKYNSLILATSESQLRPAFNLYHKLSRLNKKAYILTFFAPSDSNKKYALKNIQYYFNFFTRNYSDFTKQSSDFFNQLGNEKIVDNITLRDLTLFKGVSLWDLSVSYCFYALIPVLYDLYLANLILDLEKPTAVYAINKNTEIEKAFSLICEQKKIEFIALKQNKELISLKRFFLQSELLLKKIKRLFFSLYFYFLNLTKNHWINKKCKVAFFIPIERHFSSLLPIIQKYSEKERLVINTFLSGADSKLKQNKICYTDFSGYKLYSLYPRRNSNFLKRTKKAIYNNSYFKNKWTYEGIPIWSFLHEIFEKLFSEIFLEKIREVEIISKILLFYEPKVVVAANYSCEVILTAKSLSIPTVAVQTSHIKELCRFGSIISDAVVVNGSYWKDYLLKYDNQSEKIHVSGPTKFDLIANRNFDEGNFYKRLNLNKNYKIILYASPHDFLPIEIIKHEKREQVKAIYQAVRKIKEAYLIVKLHPYESDFDTYVRLAKEMSLRNFTIIKNIDIEELLFNCDLLISYISTVGYEAVLMDKNVISLLESSRFLFDDDGWDFKRCRVTIPANNLSFLEDNVRKALFDPLTISTLKKNRQEYISEHAYKLDGNAANRVKGVIDSFCNSKEGK